MGSLDDSGLGRILSPPRPKFHGLLNPSSTMATSHPAMFSELNGVREKLLLDMRSLSKTYSQDKHVRPVLYPRVLESKLGQYYQYYFMYGAG
jgi:hypothetical protein